MPTNELHNVFITYEEAQAVKKFLEVAKRDAPYAEARASSRRLLDELSDVRAQSYAPLRGHQLRLIKEDYIYLKDILDALELGET